MKLNKNKYVTESNEWVQLRSRIKDILLNKRTVGLAVPAIMYIIQDEIVKVKKGLK
jgi:hypothetical protein